MASIHCRADAPYPDIFGLGRDHDLRRHGATAQWAPMFLTRAKPMPTPFRPSPARYPPRASYGSTMGTGCGAAGRKNRSFQKEQDGDRQMQPVPSEAEHGENLIAHASVSSARWREEVLKTAHNHRHTFSDVRISTQLGRRCRREIVPAAFSLYRQIVVAVGPAPVTRGRFRSGVSFGPDGVAGMQIYQCIVLKLPAELYG